MVARSPGLVLGVGFMALSTLVNNMFAAAS